MGRGRSSVVCLARVAREGDAELHELADEVARVAAAVQEDFTPSIKMRKMLAIALLADADVREAVTTLEDAGRTARRVLGGSHPLTKNIEGTLQNARATLRARETPETLAQDAFRTARAKLAQERAELAKTLAADAAPVEDAASGDVTSICEAVGAMTT